MMNIVFVIVLALWIYILTVLKRGKLDFWYFITGSIGRLVFYACTVLLYFFIFTKAQIIRQKVGGFRYGTDNTDLS